MSTMLQHTAGSPAASESQVLSLRPTGLTPAQLRKRWRDADHEERRELIIDSAIDLLHRKGIDAVTVRQIATRLGGWAMTLYT